MYSILKGFFFFDRTALVTVLFSLRKLNLLPGCESSLILVKRCSSMSKNTSSNVFRRINVDDYDSERFKDDIVEGEEQGPNEAEVNAFLTQTGKNSDALEVILKNPPLGAKNQAVKDKAVMLAIRVLTTFKTSEIDGAVKSLDSKLLDVLMKYIYRGFEFPSEGSSASLLTWHEKAYAAGGAGCIVRVLTDRKRV